MKLWKDLDHEWAPHKKGISIGKSHFAPPDYGEIFYLRIFLNRVKVHTSHDEIKIINDMKYNTLKESCNAMDFLDDDEEIIHGAIEVKIWGTKIYLRSLFSKLLASDQVNYQGQMLFMK